MRGPDQTDCSCPREEMMRPELRPGSGMERREEGKVKKHKIQAKGRISEVSGTLRGSSWK